MSEYSSIVSFAIALAVNLLLFGILAASGVAVAFRLAEVVSPRLRYTVAVVAFLIAAIMPLGITLSSIFKRNPSSVATSELKQINELETGFHEEMLESELLSSQQSTLIAATKRGLSERLNNFVCHASNNQLAKVFLILWLSVSVLLLFRELVSHIRLKQILKRVRPASSSLRRELCCPDDIRLYISEFESPATVGLFRPIVVLPARFPDDVSRLAVHSILRHEAAHARQRDPLINALLRVVRAAFWISPVLWLLEAVIRAEQEAAADCSALTDFPNPASANSAMEYAASLVKIAKVSTQLSGRRRFGAAATHFGSASRLESRVRRLLAGYGKPVSGARLSLAMFVVLFTLFAAMLLPVASQQFRPNQENSDERKTGEVSQINDFAFAEQNSFTDFEKGTEGDEDKKSNAYQAANRRVKSGKMDAALESPNGIFTTPTSRVNLEEQLNGVRQENKKNESNRDVILPVQAQVAVKPSEAIKPVTPIIAVKPSVTSKPVIKPVVMPTNFEKLSEAVKP